jgi:hypothetical protein
MSNGLRVSYDHPSPYTSVANRVVLDMKGFVDA